MVSGFVMSRHTPYGCDCCDASDDLYRSTLSAIDLAGWALADLVWLVYALRSPKVVLGGPAETPPATGSMPPGQAYAS